MLMRHKEIKDYNTSKSIEGVSSRTKPTWSFRTLLLAEHQFWKPPRRNMMPGWWFVTWWCWSIKSKVRERIWRISHFTFFIVISIWVILYLCIRFPKTYGLPIEDAWRVFDTKSLSTKKGTHSSNSRRIIRSNLSLHS